MSWGTREFPGERKTSEDGTEGGRRLTGGSARLIYPENWECGPPAEETPNPEVLESPVHCKFTVNYKRKILDEANAHTEHGELKE